MPLAMIGALSLGWLARALRHSRAEHGEASLWVLGWLPDFWYALGVAAAIIAVAEWFRFPQRRRWSGVVGFLMVALFNEARTYWTKRGIFDWADVVAFTAGAGIAVMLDRWGRDAQHGDRL